MRVLVRTLVFSLCAGSSQAAPQSSPIWITDVNQNVSAGNYSDINSCWSVNTPASSSDYYAVCYKVLPGIPNTEDVAQGLPITGLGISLCLPASYTTVIPRIGVYYPLNASPCTPDLNNPVVELFNVLVSGPSNGDFVFVDTPEFNIVSGTTQVIEAMMFMPGEPFLGVGGDASSSVSGTSYYSVNGFQTPAIPLSGVDIGLCIAQDNDVTTQCTVAARIPHGRLRVARGDATSGTGAQPIKGDRLLQHVQTGDTVRLSFFGPQVGDLFMLWLMTGTCTPSTIASPSMGTIIDPDGDGAYRRLSFTWPNLPGTFDFAAFWGNAGCTPAIVGFTNCVRVMSP